jgi:hypothetical protein
MSRRRYREATGAQESVGAAHRELAVFYDLTRDAGTPDVLRLATTIRRWQPQVLSYFTSGRTNARSEAQNLITEKLRRIAHGTATSSTIGFGCCSTQASNGTLQPPLEAGAVNRALRIEVGSVT